MSIETPALGVAADGKGHSPAGGSSGSSRTFIDSLLEEQQALTAVERFSRAHKGGEVLSRRYHDLVPLSQPGAGEQFSFEVDLDRCSGCQACVTACHAMNGLDDDEAWRGVGALVSSDWRQPFRQTITTACHHCVDPACLNGCPVLAYEKDSVTGIVRHLDDQCIGCQYCVMMCPYEVPQYSTSRGIVRKCDMCSQRLAANEAPACVQACPNEAIQIRTIRIETARTLSAGGSDAFVPTAPDPAITIPTTRFVSKKPLPPNLMRAGKRIQLQPAHWALVWMLVLTQCSVGSFVLLPFLPMGPAKPLALLALAVALAGLAASAFHMGRPLKAWRSFLGLKKSWLSREIVSFGLFVPLAAAATFELWFAPLTSAVVPLSTTAAAVVGLGAVLCSAMIYHQTRRALWRGLDTIKRFYGTAMLLGMSAAWMAAALSGASIPWLPGGIALVAAGKLAFEHRLLRRADNSIADLDWPLEKEFDAWSLAQTALLLRNALVRITRWRFFCLVAGGMLLPLLSVLPNTNDAALAVLTLAFGGAGELAERCLFFRAVVPPGMPGGGRA